MIKEVSENFVKILSHKPALIPLYKNRHIILELKSDDEEIWLQFFNNHCELLKLKPDHVDIGVYGEKEQIEMVVKGDVRLTLMEEEGQITVKGSLRNLLSLESLFVLSGEGKSLIHH